MQDDPAMGTRTMAIKKLIFLSFVLADEPKCELIRKEAFYAKSRLEFLSPLSKGNYFDNWQDVMRASIHASHGIIALLSKNSLNSAAQNLVFACAREEGKRILAIHALHDTLEVFGAFKTTGWAGDTIRKFIDSV
jgi:hypothetical protein